MLEQDFGEPAEQFDARSDYKGRNKKNRDDKEKHQSPKKKEKSDKDKTSKKKIKKMFRKQIVDF